MWRLKSTGDVIPGPRNGGSGGVQQPTVYVPPGEAVIEIFGRCGENIDSLGIATTRQQVGPFGGSAGAIPFTYQVGTDQEIVGFFGRCGEVLDNLGIYVRQRNYTA
jgi:hypothetical protein